MDFALSEEQEFFRQNVARLVDDLVVPRAREIDQTDEFPRDLWEKVAGLGYLGLRYPVEAGGMNADNLTCALFYEEITRGSVGFAQSVIMNMLMGTDLVWRFGGPALRERCFAPAIRGEKIATICFTEEQSGSDLGGTLTRARAAGDRWILSGKKTWITNGPLADFATVVARTGPAKGLRGLSFFLVEKGMPGFSAGQNIPKLGCRGTVTGELILDQVAVPAQNLLGGEGQALAALQGLLDQIRIMTGAMACGIAEAAYREAVRYARERIAFGHPIGKNQLIRAKVADMAASLEAARLLVHKAAWVKDRGREAANSAALAKVFAVEACLAVVDETTRILGAYGYAEEYGAARHLRDARFLLYGGGTHEILRNFAGRNILQV